MVCQCPPLLPRHPPKSSGGKAQASGAGRAAQSPPPAQAALLLFTSFFPVSFFVRQLETPRGARLRLNAPCSRATKTEQPFIGLYMGKEPNSLPSFETHHHHHSKKKKKPQPKAHAFCLKHAYSWRFASSDIALLKSISYTQLAASERPGHRFLPSA